MGTRVEEQASFETFYKDVRSRLLLQTWALTGDLSAAQKAVRDALVIAWHHWRKVRRLERAAREDWVRPLAWARAQQRHSVPHLPRGRDADKEVKATLDALGKLPTTQRRVLLLAHLSSLSMDQLAREAGITKTRAERELQLATASVSLHRGVASTDILALFEPLAAVAGDQRWPRTSILTRAGAARRRAHTLIGAVAGVAAVAASGIFVAHGGGSVPRLESLSLHHRSTPTEAPATTAPPYPLGTDDLLTNAEVGARLGGRWATQMTSNNSASTLVLPCQDGRAPGKQTRAALARTFTSRIKGVAAGESVEASLTAAAAHTAYDRLLMSYAGCREPRMQLQFTRQVSGIGDEAMVIGLHEWQAPDRAVVVGVARTGLVTTSVTTAVAGTTARALPRATDLLGAAVSRSCRLPGAGSCTTRTQATDVAPLPAGRWPGLLSELDLPPITGVANAWAGTQPQPARQNLAATRCDQTSFTGKGITSALTRTFVIPGAKGLDPAFGLTETAGRLRSAQAADRLTAGIRDRLASCGRRELGSHVTPISERVAGQRRIGLWTVRVEISKKRSVVYLLAVIRQGPFVAELGFVPSGAATMSTTTFATLAARAADRLPHL